MKCRHREFLKVPKEYECAAKIERYPRSLSVQLRLKVVTSEQAGKWELTQLTKHSYPAEQQRREKLRKKGEEENYLSADPSLTAAFTQTP